MRTMIDLGKERGPMFGGRMHIMDTPTSIDCMSLREAGAFRRTSFCRSLLDCVIPACCSAGFQSIDNSHRTDSFSSSSSSSSSSSFGDTAAADLPATSTPPRDPQIISSSLVSSINSATTVTGTFFGNRKGRVSFSLQVHQQDHDFAAAAATRRSRRRRPSTTPPPPPVLLLLLEFGVPTSYLAREMQHGLLRIALVEQDGGGHGHHKQSTIFGVPTWIMYCNGRKVGYASRRETTASDEAILKLMQSVSVGAGVLPPQTSTSTEEIMYLRASFKRVAGSPDSESFHMINPDSDKKSSPYSSTSCNGQELSIFLLRS